MSSDADLKRGEAIIDRLKNNIRTVAGEGVLALHVPQFDQREQAEVEACIASSYVSSVGSAIGAFEDALCAITGARNAVAVVNGTAALHLALVANGIGNGDEVIVPALTFAATAHAVVHAGAVPHFVDSETTSMGIDPTALASHLDNISVMRDGLCINRNTNRRISAIMPVHIFGQVADMTGLVTVAENYGLTMIEDAAEALGSRQAGQHAGLFGACGILSFNGNKIVTTGGGGAIITNDDELANQCRHLATTAKTPHANRYVHDAAGFNYRMPALNAALGVAQLSRLPDYLRAKRTLAALYQRIFEGDPDITFDMPADEANVNHWLNAIHIRDSNVALRDMVISGLNDHGIGCRPIWDLLFELPHLNDYPRANTPVAAHLQASIINIPSSAFLAGPQ